ncbi:hypothetical protein ASPWEDRAFT_362320 [Aspergillus wentii DTO 134E9]|uniref:Uncharacterized protein n=1 Tax=Aspergillus wentii DTO 134E9 TaxID=1073089 RepID=A0A1L9RWB9_ASPWE|nr:uncharacterized protein ASPWEDRAFT_362320 [Aspergillus wentii DTO 134E9]OJJ39222.1 hypothetical protein ASPWEDRAFT_362320 [Aspergillus wentii DTO 134E9]
MSMLARSTSGENSLITYRRRWSVTRRGRRWWATRAVVHRGHSWGRGRSTQAWRSTRSTHARNGRSVSWVSSISIGGSWSTRRSLLLPRSSSRGTGGTGSTRSTVTTIAVAVASTTLGSPWGRRPVVSGAIVITAVVSASLLPGSHIAGRRATLPRLRITVIITLVGTGFNTARSVAVFIGRTSRQFIHELLDSMLVPLREARESKKAYLHLTVDSITTTNSSGVTSTGTAAAVAIVAPVRASLAVGTVTSHVACIATDTTDDIGSEVALLRAVILAVSDLTTCFGC